MERMKTRFIIAVTQRLAPAADSTAKVELIEELSDNLFNRWQDLTANGVSEDEAYLQALEDLGDVDELLAYLDSLGPEGELPEQESSVRDFTGELLHGVEGIVRETVSQTKDAVDQAAVIVRNVADKIKERYPDGFKGKIYVHVDRDEDAAAQDSEPVSDRCAAEAEEVEAEEAAEKDSGWSFTIGYNRDRGGFFCGGGHGQPTASRRVTDSAFPSQELKSLDIQLVNGDVTIALDEDPNADVRVSGQADKLEVRIREDGVLSIRQGNTASSSFFFLRGLAAADVELTLPKRFWEHIQISTVNGDIEIEDGLEARTLLLKTSSGDASFQEAFCSVLDFKSASGDLECSGTFGSVHALAASGDITMSGTLGEMHLQTSSGDIEVAGGVQELSASSASGDVCVRSQVQPQELEVSSKSGDCEVYFPGGEGFTLQFSTVSGDLETDFPLIGPMDARSGEAIYLDGGSRVFRMSSTSGDLALYQA